ncbi:MAG TPA: DinB family protein [Nocardioidaceae bacterium]|nr:DinB family protein [Nocardioidaceae bacterium]
MTERPISPERTDPPLAAGEQATLEAFLDYHRATLLMKCEGLTDGQLRSRAVPPSSMSLLGLVRHLTDVERGWFRRVWLDEQAPPLYWTTEYHDHDFDDVDTADVQDAFRRYLEEVEVSRRITAEHTDLGATSARAREGGPVSLRWIYAHMVEEYARHNGHADLLRERLDGVTGE